MFSYIVKNASARGSRCLILTNRVELLEQAGGTFENFGIDYENITAKTKVIPRLPVAVGMVETIKRRCKSRLDFQMYLRSVQILIIDEVHIAAFDPVFEFLNPDCYVLGFTATPIRQNKKKQLKDNFTELVPGPPIQTLINGGFLARPKYFGVSVDLSKVKMKAGEFDERDQEKVFSETKVFEGLKHNLDKNAKGLKTMIFCPSVNSSLEVARELDCLHVDGTMLPDARTFILRKFETTPGAILTNCAITTTGYDCPGIECIVLYRATTSLPLYLQMIGRGSRVTDAKRNFIILDFGMNVQRHGYWHSERTWSLEVPKKRGKKKDSFPVRFCPECGAILAAQVRTCEYCGYVFPITEKERVFAELQELTYAEIQSKAKNASLEMLEQIRVAKGYKIGWVLNKFSNPDQFADYGRLRNYHPKWAKIQSEIFLK